MLLADASRANMHECPCMSARVPWRRRGSSRGCPRRWPISPAVQLHSCSAAAHRTAVQRSENATTPNSNEGPRVPSAQVSGALPSPPVCAAGVESCRLRRCVKLGCWQTAWPCWSPPASAGVGCPLRSRARGTQHAVSATAGLGQRLNTGFALPPAGGADKTPAEHAAPWADEGLPNHLVGAKPCCPQGWPNHLRQEQRGDLQGAHPPQAIDPANLWP